MVAIGHRRASVGHRSRFLALLLPLVLLGGCIETRVEVRVQPDGSGTRSVEMVWEEGTLEELELADADVRAILNLTSERGWSLHREARPNRGGKSVPHVIFRRETRIASLSEWATVAPDLGVGVDATPSPRIRDQVRVEIGRGPHDRTVSYREVLDGSDLREVLDRFAARHLADRIALAHPDLSATTRAEIRGLIRGHLSHVGVWLLEDEDVSEAEARLLDVLVPQLTRLIDNGESTPADVEAMRSTLDEAVSGDGDLGDRLEEKYPGLSLLAFMNLKLEVSVGGTIVESNADRVVGGSASWEIPMWNAIDGPLEFFVRSRIED